MAYQGARNGANGASDDSALDRISGHGRADRSTAKATDRGAFFRLRARTERRRQYQNSQDSLHFRSSLTRVAVSPPTP
ncbi:hypothetical protein ASE05_18950 [Mesorhizobium sp. Root172]|uniref:Uncharacterized protein n=1 Tax=Rhizobium loti TaxID=381 RepID=A0AA91F9C1_RHILI|nr:hypothetical protein ASE05_18950 [Mesorhizobium sp. Root172]OBQ65463.1 hypothetical protein A8145_14945 [Mesorhizobium loti]